MLSLKNMKILLLSFILVICFSKTYSAIKNTQSIQLNEDNWEQILTGDWMVEFYAPWCPACKSLEPIWRDFSTWSEDLNIKVGQVDVTEAIGLSGRFMVTALPTIFHVHNGEFRQYRGARDKDEFISFIEDKKWEKLETIPGWKSPQSIPMSLLSYFYKLSMTLRNVHTYLMEEYGLPTWGSYIIFAVVTIMCGALLGLILVCIIDCIYPQGQATKTYAAMKPDSDMGDGDDVIMDDVPRSDDSQEEDSQLDEEDEEVTNNEEEVSELSQEEIIDEEENNKPTEEKVRRRKTRKD